MFACYQSVQVKVFSIDRWESSRNHLHAVLILLCLLVLENMNVLAHCRPPGLPSCHNAQSVEEVVRSVHKAQLEVAVEHREGILL